MKIIFILSSFCFAQSVKLEILHNETEPKSLIEIYELKNAFEKHIKNWEILSDSVTFLLDIKDLDNPSLIITSWSKSLNLFSIKRPFLIAGTDNSYEIAILHQAEFIPYFYDFMIRLGGNMHSQYSMMF